MSRDYNLYLYDILEACEKIRSYIEGLNFDTFSVDSKTVDAVVRNLEIIGEAVKNVPPEMLAGHDIEWKRIARFRDIIAHHYFKVELEIVWDITQERIDELTTAVSAILNQNQADTE